MADEDNKPVVEVKTADSESQQTANNTKKSLFYASKEATDYNVLNDYRSYNYVWTLAALSKEEYNDPTFLKNEKAPLKYVILKSGGKGTRELASKRSFEVPIGTTETDDQGQPLRVADEEKTQQFQELLSEFNSNGLGRYDFYIDNLEVVSYWSQLAGSMPQAIRFDVVEPLSVHGFIESINANALAAGYDSYVQATYVLKLEFWGYKDTAGVTKASQVPKATRYIPISINEVTLETSERGTIYHVAANPTPAAGLSDIGKTSVSVKMKGSTVEEVLKNLMDQLTETRKNDNGDKESTDYNEYSIEFLPGTDPEGNPNTGENKIAKSKINEELRSNQVFIFPSPADKNDKSAIRTTAQPESAKYDPTAEAIQFGSGVAILDIVTAVIRDSKYSADLLGDFETAISKNNGMIPWFRVSVYTEIKPGKNDKTGSLNYKLIYKVQPYYVHYTRFPNNGQGMFAASDIKGQIRREYNYIYTGKNVDILNFNLKFNNLYFQARSFNFGNKDASTTGAAMGASNEVKVEAQENPSDPTKNPTPGARQLVAVNQASQVPEGGTGKVRQNSPYFNMALAIHEEFLKAQDLMEIDFTIIGDPYYFVTSNTSNVMQTTESGGGITDQGEAPFLDSAVFVNLNFRNPKDIKPTGWVEFQDGLLPFSGIYQVQNVTNTFREGKFEQRIHGLRMKGQILDKKSDLPKNKLPKTSPKAGEQKTKDSAPSNVPRNGFRPTDTNLWNMLSRGLPSAGLPGILANFTNAAGGALGGVGTKLQTTLQRVDESLANGLAPVNGALQQAQSLLNVAAQVGGLVAIGKALVNGVDGTVNSPGLGQDVGGYNPYSSGIRLSTSGLTNIATSQDTINQANVNAQSNLISSFVQDSNNLRTLNQNYFNNVLDTRIAPTDLKVSNAEQNIATSTRATPADPTAIAAQLGIDPKQLSGLSADQQSDILSKLLALANKVPENTNIAGLKALGMSMSNIYGASIPNLPALQPLTLAPLANIPNFDLQKILAGGGNIANLPGALTIPNIAAFLALLSNKKTSNGVAGGIGQINSQVAYDKIDTAQNLSSALESLGYGSTNIEPAQLGLGSVESVSANNSNIVQGYGGYYVMNKTAYALYDTQRKQSPIDKLMQTKV